MPPIKRNRSEIPSSTRRRVAGRPAGPTPATHTTSTPSTGAGTAVGGGTQPRTGVGATEEASTRRRRGARLARPLAVAALVVGLAAGGAGAYLGLTSPGGDAEENQAFVDRQATEEVLAAASTNVQRLVAIDHETLDDYHSSLDEFLTPNLVAKLEESWPTLKDTYEQSKTTVDAHVLEAGLTHLNGDEAEVLLVQDVSMSRDGAATGSTSGTYLVGLQKVDGVWKLSRIPDLPS